MNDIIVDLQESSDVIQWMIVRSNNWYFLIPSFMEYGLNQWATYEISLKDPTRIKRIANNIKDACSRKQRIIPKGKESFQKANNFVQC